MKPQCFDESRTWGVVRCANLYTTAATEMVQKNLTSSMRASLLQYFRASTRCPPLTPQVPPPYPATSLLISKLKARVKSTSSILFRHLKWSCIRASSTFRSRTLMDTRIMGLFVKDIGGGWCPVWRGPVLCGRFLWTVPTKTFFTARTATSTSQWRAVYIFTRNNNYVHKYMMDVTLWFIITLNALDYNFRICKAEMSIV